LSTSVVDGRIYAIGGTAGAPYSPGDGLVEMYDPATDHWARKAHMPAPRWNLSTSVVDGRIYAIGGLGGNALPTVEMYDAATDTWTRKADMPTARIGFSTSVVDHRIYAMGGDPAYGFGPFTRSAEIYDPDTDIWVRTTGMPEAGHTMATGVVDHRIYLVSGEYIKDWAAGPAVFAYDPGQPHLLQTATVELLALADLTMPLAVEVVLKGASTDGSPLPLQLDLAALGVPAPVRFEYQGERRYTANPDVAVREPGRYYLPVQLAPEGELPSLLYAVPLVVLPSGEQVLFSQQTAGEWTFAPQLKAQVEPASLEMPYEGQAVLAIRTSGIWGLEAQLSTPVDRTGYGALRLVMHPGDATGNALTVSVNNGPQWNLLSRKLAGAWVDPENKGWQEVTIPLERLGVEAGEAFSSLTLKGNLKGSLYLGHLALLPAELPTTEQAIYAEGMAAGWRLTTKLSARVDPAATAVVYQGQKALAVLNTGMWRVVFEPEANLYRIGYRALRLALRPGEMAGDELLLWVNGQPVGLVPGVPGGTRIDPADKSWQVVEIPLGNLDLEPMESITSVALSGNAKGTFYLDEVYLVPASLPTPTAVLEAYTAALPARFSLEPNYPNPFNSETAIRFALPESGQVELAVYNVAGQKVATLARGAHAAGTYAVKWDGVDDQHHALASGVYLLRLRAGEFTQSRSMLLLK
jgi:hypothetical protein